MRVVDLDRDMSDVIPTGMSPDSEFLFARMTGLTLDRAEPAPGRRILDVASGVGQDTVALAARGAAAVGAEPSGRMTGMAQLQAAQRAAAMPGWVRSWADALPFADDSFDAAFCKGALDHFDRPLRAIAEMARVVKPEGRVVLAIANFDSLSCRVGRSVDDVREQWLGVGPRQERRGYDAPSDHFTRYEVPLMREQADAHLEVETFEGVSLGWGMPGWSALCARLPDAVQGPLLRGLDWCARQAPSLADVVVLAGRPRSTSA